MRIQCFNSKDPEQLLLFKQEAILAFQEGNANTVIKWDSKLGLHACYYRNRNEALKHLCLNEPDEDGLVFGYEKGFSPTKPSYRWNN